MAPNLLIERRRQRLIQRQYDLLRHMRGTRLRARRQKATLRQVAQSLHPGRDGGRTILRCHPGEIITIARHPRKDRSIALVRINRQQLLHQDRSRPAIQKNVMAGEYQPMLLTAKPDQRKAQQRR